MKRRDADLAVHLTNVRCEDNGVQSETEQNGQDVPLKLGTH